MTYEDQDDGPPVLNAVVKSGNESIIQSSRLGRQVLHELDMLQQSKPVKFVLQDHILDDDDDDDDEGDIFTQKERQLNLGIDHLAANGAHAVNGDDEIEFMIDQIVDRHIHELRRDIRRLLIRVKQEP